MKLDIEQQFLPAVLEIQQTPPSPIGRSIIGLIVLFFICSILWACLGFIDIVSVAAGKIIPNGHVKVIQSLEIGKVTAIHIKEGQSVQQGESLIELDSSTINAEISQLMTEQKLAELQRKRLQWLADQQKNVTRDQMIEWETKDPVLSSQWREYQDRLKTLLADKDKRQAEYNAAKQQAEKLTAILPIITERSRNEKTLVERKLYPNQQYLETEQQRLTILYDLKSQHSQVNELQQTIEVINAQIQHAKSEFSRSNLEKKEEANH